MSASYVRNTIRQWAQETAAATGFGFYDTVNTEQDPQDSVWWTVDFFALQMEGTFCKPGYIETGLAYVDVFAQPGRGDIAAVQAMEQIVPEMFQKVDPTQRLIIERYDPLEEASRGTAQQAYQLSVALTYHHSL